MQVTRKNLSDTKVQLTLVADEQQLAKAKQQAIQHAGKDLKVAGFRQGKIPAAIVEKNIDANVLGQEFIEHVMNDMYSQALDQEKLRPVAQPQVTVKKFVPFTTVEIEAEVDIIGAIKLADYKKLKSKKDAVKVTAEAINDVLKQLQAREAEKKDVERAAKKGDQVIIDFRGVDAETKEPIKGTDGNAYPLALGSDSFIPGFEAELIGLKADDKKTFDITFPEDYGVASLQKRVVTFTVTIRKVQEMTEPKLDDEFAAKVGPFKTLAELKEDIKKQLTTEQENQAQRAFEEKLLNELADSSAVAVPDSLIEAELDRMDEDERQNLVYRGQTWQEHLDADGITEEEHRARNREQAERRIKAGLVLAEVAQEEKVDVTRDELDLRLQLLKGQYQDKAMQAELDKPENQREIASRLLTEKTIALLVGFAAASKQPAKA
jgi:trigger factor